MPEFKKEDDDMRKIIAYILVILFIGGTAVFASFEISDGTFLNRNSSTGKADISFTVKNTKIASADSVEKTSVNSIVDQDPINDPTTLFLLLSIGFIALVGFGRKKISK
jgi:hypothetical protein